MSNFPPPPPPYGSQPPPPPYGAPVPAPAGKVKLRGRIPLRLAAIFGVIGLALAITGIVLIVNSPLSKTGDFPRVAINEQTSVRLERTGGYVIYFETPSGGSHSANIQVQVLDPSGDPVGLKRYGNTLTYDVDGRHAEAAFTFRASESGRYEVNSSSSDAPGGAQLSFGESVANGIVGGVLTFIPGLLLVIVAVILLIVGLVRRSRHKRELASAYRGGPGPNYFTGR